MVVHRYYSDLSRRAESGVQRRQRYAPGEVRGRTLYLVYYQGVACLLALVALLFSGGFAAIDGLTAFLATITGVFLTLSSLLSLLALKTGTLALGTFASSAGLIIPAAAGIFLFDEPLSLWQWGGVALMLCSAFLLGSSSKEQKGTFSLKTVWILLGSMAANGAVMLCQKYFAERVPDGSVSAYSFLTFLIPALALGIFLAVPSKQPLKPLDRRLYLYGGPAGGSGVRHQPAGDAGRLSGGLGGAVWLYQRRRHRDRRGGGRGGVQGKTHGEKHGRHPAGRCFHDCH